MAPSFLSPSLLMGQDGCLQGFPLGMIKLESREPKELAGKAENYLLEGGPWGSGFLGIRAPKPNQIPSARLL